MRTSIWAFGLRTSTRLATTPSLNHARLHSSKRVHRDERVVDRLGRPHPLLLAVPAHDRLVAGAHVLDVEEDLLSPLLRPYLVAGIARVGEDGSDSGRPPGEPVPVTVAPAVVSAGLGEALQAGGA